MHYIFICRREPFWVYTPLARNVIMNFQAAKKGLTHRINSQLHGRPPPRILNFEYSQCEKREIRERILANWAEKFPIEWWFLSKIKHTGSLCFDAPQPHFRLDQPHYGFFTNHQLCAFLSFIAFFYFHDRRGFDEMHFLLVSESKKS